MIDDEDKPAHVSWKDWWSMDEGEKRYELDVDSYICNGKWPDENDFDDF